MSLADGAEAAPFPARDGPPEDAAPRMKSAFAVDGPAPGAAPPAAPPPPPAGRRAACWHWTRTRLFREQLDTPLDASFVLLAATVYGAAAFAIGAALLPGAAAWATALMWASALVAAALAHQLRLPRVVGMLAAGVLLRNVPWSAIDAFPAAWGRQMRAAALATIFLRCGLELDFGTMRRYRHPAARLALVPGLAEALFDAGLGVALFQMPFLLALTMGFILKAVGPGLVVPAMFRLQKAGAGAAQGIPSIVVISASFDDVIAITGYAIFSTLAIQPAPGATSDTNDAWAIASGPVQVVFGVLGGILFGGAVGVTRLWDTRPKRAVAVYGAALFLMFMLEYWKLLSGGALGALFTGLVASNAWEKGFPRRWALGPSLEYSPEAERTLSVVWRWVMEPILFVTVGASLDFASLPAGSVARAAVIVCAGVTLRVLVTYVAMSGFGYSRKEKAFFALAWSPKATVQAALSAAPLALIESLKAGAPDYDEWVAWGNDILVTGTLAIVICGTLGVLAIHYSAPRLLQWPPAGGAGGGGAGGAGGERAGAADGSAHGAAHLPHIIRGEDSAVVADFVVAVRALTAAAEAGAGAEEVARLAAAVAAAEGRVDGEVGRREPSVRELFRAASAAAARRPVTARRLGSGGRRKSFDDAVRRRPPPPDDAV